MRFTKRKIVFALVGAGVAGGVAGRVTRLLNAPKAADAHVAEPPQKRTLRPLDIVENVYDARLGAGWQDWGWGRHDLTTVGPARVVFGGYAGIAFHHKELPSDFSGVTFRFRAPGAWPPFLSVWLKHAQQPDSMFPRIELQIDDLADAGQGWLEAWVAWSRLNPHHLPIDRVVIGASRQVGSDLIEIDKVGLTKRQGEAGPAPVRPVELAILCDQEAKPIDPMIYGVTMGAWETGATAHRIGGNPITRLNWSLGAAWNAGRDWFFENTLGPGNVGEWVNEATAHRARTALSVPMIGWVAKDTHSASFPVAKFGKQHATDPHRPEVGDGIGPDGSKLAPGPPTETSVAAPPEKIAEWVTALRARDGKPGERGVFMYILDNEPSLWNEIHRDVHPSPVTQDELLDRTVRYATAIRGADPEPLIAGPAEWGWTGYLYSAKDRELDTNLRPDRRAHGDLPLVAWYLQALKEHEKNKGVRLLDALDLHFYPQAERVFGVNARTDPEGSALRIRSTRALWDPNYVDESWIGEPIRLIPRMKEWVKNYNAGLKTSIGEWSFGADDHISGALATAEALGRFGQQGLDSAFYWGGPKPGTKSFWAFRAFRNFDGNGAHFLDESVPTRESKNVSIFASRDKAGTHLVAIILNLDPTYEVRAIVRSDTCGKTVARRTFSYTGDPRGVVQDPRSTTSDNVAEGELIPPYSIRILDLSLNPSP